MYGVQFKRSHAGGVCVTMILLLRLLDTIDKCVQIPWLVKMEHKRMECHIVIYEQGSFFTYLEELTTLGITTKHFTRPGK